MKNYWFIGVFWFCATLLGQSNTDIQLADLYFNKKDYPKAALYYQKLYDQYPSDLYYQRLLISYLTLEQFEKATQLNKEQLKKFPNNAIYLADAYHVLRLQKSPKAKKFFEKDILNNLGNNRNQIIQLGNALMSKKYFDETLLVYEKAESENRFMRLQYERATVYGMQGAYEEMTEIYVDILVNAPNAMNTVQIYLSRFLNVDTDPDKALLLKKVLLKKIQEYPEAYGLKQMLVWAFVQQKEYKAAFVQLKAIDRRNGGAAEELLDLAYSALHNDFVELALEIYDYLALRYDQFEIKEEAALGKLECQFKLLEKGGDINAQKLKEDLNSAMYTYGYVNNQLYILRAKLQAYYLNEGTQLIASLNDTLEAFSSKRTVYNELKLIVGDVYLQYNDLWEAELQYNQVYLANKDDELGHLAKYKSAKIAFYRGDFKWCQEQLKILKAASSKLIANDALSLSVIISDHVGLDSNEYPLKQYAEAELWYNQGKFDEAYDFIQAQLEDFKGTNIQDDFYWLLFEIDFKKGNYLKAIHYLNLIIEEFPNSLYTDDAWYKKGEIYEFALNQQDKAKEAYEYIILNYDSSVFVVPARERYRNMEKELL